ncbi:MAG: DUF697 domain-containing protein [Bernardetiaceae bacterium]
MLDYLFYKFKEKMGMDTDNERAERIVERSVGWSLGAGLIPIPLADMVAVTAIQIDMVHELCKIYGVDFRRRNLESWLNTLAGSALPKLGSQAIKMIPGVGAVVGGVSMAILSGASTYATGRVFVTHFEKGGTLEDFDAEAVKSFYQQEFEKGKQFARQMQDEFVKRGKAAQDEFSEADEVEVEVQPTAAKDPLDRLNELMELRQAGTISEEEFQQLKRRLFENL